jgi:Uncharacterised nucleotidyltransferase
MKPMPDLIVQAMRDPASALTLTPVQWDLLIRLARRTELLARLAYRFEDAGLLDKVPQRMRMHLISAVRMSERHDHAVRWEIQCLRKEIAQVPARVTLLKGAAYLIAGLPAARGRIFSDVDILVPRAHLDRTESELMLHGWQHGEIDDYDQQYYRRWMHEIPPMRHLRRGTSIDVHHAILPETARVKVDTQALLEAVVPLAQAENFFVLEPTDMLLHSATHLFHEGELEKGLRDLFDLDSLMRHFGGTPGFWEALVPRAQKLGLTRPLFYALRYASQLLGTPVPQAVLDASVVGKPSPLVLWIMDACYARALRPDHASADTAGTGSARFVLYVRSHWIRMPWHLLAFHLGRKALLRLKKDEKDKIDVADADRQEP